MDAITLSDGIHKILQPKSNNTHHSGFYAVD